MDNLITKTAQEIQEQCQAGASVSDVISLLDDFKKQLNLGVVMDWVAVKDNLPSEKGSYLVCEEECIFEAFYYKEYDCWGDYEVAKYENVTHWMHLPKPPCA